ncbi:C4-dicarboxylic acid transporter DauA [Planctomycetes bacterium CA13]|uniref:C4-dicarboxylic acid transporter DauA n=1 Tax=Novipirellula herctigrandis TaxID=2527986 RepID=A0A5C5YUQ2_9BACT|nr:C4-dicarboxylic acid transporter DauA [Planctomycetes bacterium CA13]
MKGDGNGSERLVLFSAMRAAWKSGYSRADFKADVGAGIVVGVVALPLSMALAIACGVPPQNGLFTAIVAGGLVALLGGSRVSVTGPTAAFVVILSPITAKFGLGGLLVASMMAGMIQVLLGAARLGRLIQIVPHPVTTGFTSGIAVVIATLQIKDFLGLDVDKMPETYLERVHALVFALPSISWTELLIGTLTLILLVVSPRVLRRIPGPLVALTIASLVALVLPEFSPGFDVATINDRFSFEMNGQQFAGIPKTPPTFEWPWRHLEVDGVPTGFSFGLMRELLVPAIAIAMLGAIESLLCAVVADGMTQSKHDPDGELLAQGIGNIVAPFFGGFAATAAIARTATGIRAGSRSPVAAIIHALFVLSAMLALAPLLGYLPMAALSALLLTVAWKMSEAKHFMRVVREAPRSDIVVLGTCFILTVVFDMVISVTVGMVLAAFLFMQRMAELSNVRVLNGMHPQLVAKLPPEVCLYEVNGPLFFGAAAKATDRMAEVTGDARALMLYLGNVSMIDMTGLIALESAVANLQNDGVMVVLAGVNDHVAKVIKRSSVINSPSVSLHSTLASAEMFLRLALPDHLNQEKGA